MALLVISRRPVVRTAVVAVTVVLFAVLLKMPALIRDYENRQRTLQELSKIRAVEEVGFDHPPLFRHQFDSLAAAKQDRQIGEKLRAMGPQSVIFLTREPNQDSASPKTKR